MPTRWIAWGRSLFALVVVGMLLALGVANIAQRAQLHQVEDGVLWADRAEGVTAVEVAGASPAASAGIQRGDVILAINGAPIERRAEVEEYQRRGSRGDTPFVHAGAAWYPSGRGRVARPRARTAARCTSCWLPWAWSRSWSAARYGCGAPAIRRRSIFSGCVSPSSGPSRSRSTARSIDSTGSSSGVTRWPWRSCHRCCCTSRWSSRNDPPAAVRTGRICCRSRTCRPSRSSLPRSCS